MPPSVETSRCIAGRYVLRNVIGRGGHGEVWEASDTLTHALVAIKLLRSDAGFGAKDAEGDLKPQMYKLGGEPARVRREVSALRLLRIPGVVQMLDEGIDDGQPFLVMERVAGSPFPAAANRSWSSIATTTLALLETLDRVHAAGVVHRDIKPGNVLVDEHGHPTLLDFGLSLGPSLVRDSRDDGHIRGTPGYLAPEQIVGETITPATDLYALGVMLYEALSGHLPHETDDFQTLMRLRLTVAPPRLADIAPDVPVAIANAIDSLLARTPKERPQSASELIDRLRDRTVHRGTFRGDRSAVDALVAAAREKRSVDLAGMRGTGRTHTLQEVAAVLADMGLGAVWTVPGKRPFSSLVNVMDVSDEPKQRKPDPAAVDRALAEMLNAGRVILADDEAGLDRHSRSALERARSFGSVIRVVDTIEEETTLARDDVVVLALWPEARLRDLFVGPDRIFHLREDAAHELCARSQGLPSRIFGKLASWERAGLAQKVGHQWMLSREALDRIAAQIERAQADPIEIVAETLALAEPLVLQGWLGRATALLLEGLWAARQGAAQGSGGGFGAKDVEGGPKLQMFNRGESRILGWLVELAIADGSPRALDSVLYELCRVAHSTAETEALEQLVRAALAMRTIGGDRAISLVDGITPFLNLDLERARQQVRVQSARRCSFEREQSVLAEAEVWARHAGERAQARFSGWLGRLRYREGRFDEAAELHAKAAIGEPWTTERVATNLNCASALIEAFRFDEAVVVADEARRLSAECRHVYYEARAEWLMRMARYRRGDLLDVDEELVDLAAQTGVVDLEALVGLTEAAIAWRRGDMERMVVLARRTEQRWTMLDNTWGALFARTLAIAATGTSTEEWDALAHAATEIPVSGAGIQMLGLLALRRADAAAELMPAMIELRNAIPERHWRYRMDVLSVDEAWAFVEQRWK